MRRSRRSSLRATLVGLSGPAAMDFARDLGADVRVRHHRT
jgi:hypothetical protein